MNQILLYISPIVSAIMMIVSVMTFVKKNNKETKEELIIENNKFDDINTSLLKSNMKLDHICSTTNETRTDIKVLTKDMNNLDKRVSNLEVRMQQIENEKGLSV